MNFTAKSAGDELVVVSDRGVIPVRRIKVMVKIRLQGTTNDIKRMRRAIERNRDLSVISTSEVFPNKGTTKYFRQYMDVTFRAKEANR